MEHDYEVYMHDRLVPVKQRSAATTKDSEPNVRSVPTSRELDTEEEAKTSEEPILGTASAPSTIVGPSTNCLDDAALETYWGQLLTPSNTPSPIFSRLTTAIFTHFDTTSAGVLQPSEFCALMSASGYTPQDFPPLHVTTNESSAASPADLQSLDAWLADWMRSFPLDHATTTRTFAPPPPIEPVNGRVRFRDQFMHALTHPDPPPAVPDGQPLLTRLGLEQYFVHLLLQDPETLAGRLNHLLGALPTAGTTGLTDPATGRDFEARVIPRSCFPPPLVGSPTGPLETAAERESAVEQQQHRAEVERRSRQLEMQAELDALAAVSRGMGMAMAGWRVDSSGHRYWYAGL